MILILTSQTQDELLQNVKKLDRILIMPAKRYKTTYDFKKILRNQHF